MFIHQLLVKTENLKMANIGHLFGLAYLSKNNNRAACEY